MSLFIADGAIAFTDLESRIHRDPESGFPRCFETGENENIFFKWKNKLLRRRVEVSFSEDDCSKWEKRRKNVFVGWRDITPEIQSSLPVRLQKELQQVFEKGNELRSEHSAEDYLENHPINEFSEEVNKELSKKYGKLFSAQVYKAFVESKPHNKRLRKTVLDAFDDQSDDLDFTKYSNEIEIIVSLGLGWEEDYSKSTPSYIKNFFLDMRNLGLQVHVLKKDDIYGKIDKNSESIKSQLETLIKKDKNYIVVSLCKGTPEVLKALYDIKSDLVSDSKIIGFINLSGMGRGTFFARSMSKLFVPKLFSPLLRVFPMKSASYAGKMVNAVKYIKADIVSGVMDSISLPSLARTTFVNVTGVPLSDYVIKNKSAMLPVLKYNRVFKASKIANDGFIELPYTELPIHIAPNQSTLVLDATHMLVDGQFEGHSIADKKIRDRLYRSMLKYILKERGYE